VDVYVYGVLRASRVGAPAEGVDGQKVSLVKHGAVAALVSDAPTVPVRATRRNLLAHSRVLQDVVQKRCILPMQFGVVMPGRDSVREELLEARAEELTAQLEAFDPYVELDVRALCPEETLLRAAVARTPKIEALRARLEGRPADATYYERIELGELVARAVSEQREAITQRIAATLEPLAAATEIGEPLHDDMVANTAFLVERARVSAFDEAVDQLGKELGEDIRMRYVGPLPPHNFVDLATEPAAWA
jgi:plasmid stabilization system protein ParE